MTNVCHLAPELRGVGVNFRTVVPVHVKKSSTFLRQKRRHHVQQQRQQQPNYRSEGREAAPAGGQYPEDQGTNLWHTNTEDRLLNGGDKLLLDGHGVDLNTEGLCQVPFKVTQKQSQAGFWPTNPPAAATSGPSFWRGCVLCRFLVCSQLLTYMSA